MARFIERNIQILIPLKNALYSRNIPEDYLEWIDSGIRQSTWISSNVATALTRSSGNYLLTGVHPTKGLSIEIPVHLIGRDRSIALIDYYSGLEITSLNQAIEQLNRLKLQWQEHIKQDAFFGWINRDNTEDKLSYFWDWLKKRNTGITNGQSSFRDYEHLLNYFDNSGLSIAEKELLGSKARKAWNQLKNRENSVNKKQCNFLLTKVNVQKLEKLSLKHKLSRTEIIEILIESESKNEAHIEARLHRRKQLTDPI